MTDGPDELVSASEAARRFGVDPRTLRRAIRSGRLQVYTRPIYAPRLIWLRPADVEALLAPARRDARKAAAGAAVAS